MTQIDNLEEGRKGIFFVPFVSLIFHEKWSFFYL